jgi:peptidoglycan/xylan/chitin deacetylase (PgdA/CDA1 family)
MTTHAKIPRIPFQERKTPSRALLDLAAGRYPGWLFGLPMTRAVPVFHFHEVQPARLEPCLRYLAHNGYRTVGSAELAHWVLDGMHPGPRSVVLTFDDAWASLWTVAFPLLRRYGLRAVTFAIPGRIQDAPRPRKTLDDGVDEPEAADRSDVPFATWPELRAMRAAGVVDVQSHTYRHGMIFCSEQVVEFLRPGRVPPLLSLPALGWGPEPRFAPPDAFGLPLYLARSRMSDARRYVDDEAARAACLDWVRENGGPAAFEREDWSAALRERVAAAPGRLETDDERTDAMRGELVRAREALESRLDAQGDVRQVCFPWAVCGEEAERLAREAGYTTGVADALFGKRVVRAGQNPFRIMRLKHPYIFCLPGAGRRNLLGLRRQGRGAV